MTRHLTAEVFNPSDADHLESSITFESALPEVYFVQIL